MSSHFKSSIQGLKGLCALVVFLSHTLMTFQSETMSSLQVSPFHLFFDGQCAVMVFFAISGYFYFKEEKPDWKKYFHGIRKKVWRIYPAYIIVMLIGAYLCNLGLSYNHSLFSDWSNEFWNTHISPTELIKQLSIIIPHDSKLIDSPVWYLNVEVKCFIVIPLITMIYNCKWGGVKTFIPFWILMLFGYVDYVGFYLLGSLAHYIQTRVHNQNLYKGAPLAIMVIFALLLLNIKNEITTFNPHISGTCQAIGAAMLVFVISSKEIKALSNKLMVWLGDISYEIYLIHFIVILTLKHFITNVYLFVPTVLAITLICSIILHYGLKFTIYRQRT